MGASGSGDGVCFWQPAMVSEPTPGRASSPHYSVDLPTRPLPITRIESPLTSTETSESTMFCRRLRRLAARHRYCLSGMGRGLEFGSRPASRSSEDWRSNVLRRNLGCVRGVSPVLGLRVHSSGWPTAPNVKQEEEKTMLFKRSCVALLKLPRNLKQTAEVEGAVS